MIRLARQLLTRLVGLAMSRSAFNSSLVSLCTLMSLWAGSDPCFAQAVLRENSPGVVRSDRSAPAGEIRQPGLTSPLTTPTPLSNISLGPNDLQVPGGLGLPAGLTAPAIPAGLDASNLTSRSGLSNTLKIMFLLTVLTLAPSILMMTTCFIRFVIVLGLLRQALGTQQLPPNQVITSICLFLTFLVMTPVWTEAYESGIRPYTSPKSGEPMIDEWTAFNRTVAPIRNFMAEQIDRTGSSDSVWMFIDFLRPPADSPAFTTWQEPQTYDDVPLVALLPAYMLSELKVSFLIAFQIYLPFLIIDMVISSILISMGMMMLPPVLISLPFKLLLFVMIDGWFLTVGMLLESVRPAG